MSEPQGQPAPPEGRPHTTRALVLVVVAVVIAVLVLRHTGSSSTGHRATAPADTTTTSVRPTTTTTIKPPFIPPSRTTVQVLNGLQTGSLAGNLSTRLTADGFKTLKADNTTAVTQTSVIYVTNRSYFREGVSLAIRLHLTRHVVYRKIPTTAPIPTGLAARADLVVIIGTSLQTLASTP